MLTSANAVLNMEDKTKPKEEIEFFCGLHGGADNIQQYTWKGIVVDIWYPDRLSKALDPPYSEGCGEFDEQIQNLMPENHLDWNYRFDFALLKIEVPIMPKDLPTSNEEKYKTWYETYVDLTWFSLKDSQELFGCDKSGPDAEFKMWGYPQDLNKDDKEVDYIFLWEGLIDQKDGNLCKYSEFNRSKGMTGAGIYVRNQPSGWKLCGVHVADFPQEGFSIGCLFNKTIFAQKFEPETLD